MLIPVAWIHYEWRMYQDLYVSYLMIISWEVTITNEGWHLPTKQESVIRPLVFIFYGFGSVAFMIF